MWILSFKNWKVNTLPSKNIQTEQCKYIFLLFRGNERRKKQIFCTWIAKSSTCFPCTSINVIWIPYIHNSCLMIIWISYGFLCIFKIRSTRYFKGSFFKENTLFLGIQASPLTAYDISLPTIHTSHQSLEQMHWFEAIFERVGPFLRPLRSKDNQCWILRFQSSDLFVFFIVLQRLTLVSNVKRKISKSNKSELWNHLSYRNLPYFFEVGSKTFRNLIKVQIFILLLIHRDSKEKFA